MNPLLFLLFLIKHQIFESILLLIRIRKQKKKRGKKTGEQKKGINDAVFKQIEETKDLPNKEKMNQLFLLLLKEN